VLTHALDGRVELGRRARARALTRFSPDTIFPLYMDALMTAQRAKLPRPVDVLRLAQHGYPVLPAVPRPRTIVNGLRRRAPSIVRRFGARNARPSTIRVGWITYDSFPDRKRHFRQLDAFTGMRAGNCAEWINEDESDVFCELYHTDRLYDIVVFQKMMDAHCQAEAQKIRASGGRVVFDANVNYYEIWGDYFVPGTRPTDQLHADAVRMTTAADWVIADSTYLSRIIEPLNPRVTVIPDNVDLSVYKGVRRHRQEHPIRLVWCGVGKKAAHLLVISDVLSSLPNVELVLVVDSRPECLPELERVVRCRVVPFSDRRYAKTLLQCDVVISPKRLINAYEMGHTEYKITLGMAAGLPAVASPQQSYVEAIGHRHAGMVADSPEEWRDALSRLASSPDLRAELGVLARQTVVERYATHVVAPHYLSLLRSLAGLPQSELQLRGA
jgi:glycosyltransferase involved in cell wall biosynthesis